LLVFGICHHSNIYLPQKITKLVSFVIVTPRYHYNHHLLDLKYANSNYGSIFTFWDRLHRTYSPPLFENNKELGLINKRKVSKLSLWDLLKMPFNL
jgi:sterol desaturase/sphingolipid hydroxylase (fatty acid hydroxylase superfamily)